MNAVFDKAVNMQRVKLLLDYRNALKDLESASNLIAKAKALKWACELLVQLGYGENEQKANQSANKEYADVLVKNYENKLLLVQRSHQDTFKAGHWWIVGGQIEVSETPEQAVKRELEEETGIVANNLTFLEMATLDSGAISYRFACVSNSDDMKLQKSELANFAWVTIEEAKSYQLVGSYSDLEQVWSWMKGLRQGWRLDRIDDLFFYFMWICTSF